MPANKKHLTPSFHQRFAKITAGFLGGYFITSTLFMVLALYTDRAVMLVTLRFGGFILWCVLMIIPFLFRNGWKAWGIYLVTTLLFSSILYFTKTESPELFPV
ncbi:hypothetical protein JMN32_15490 [Fulvivirga sp. 29W222]|uniref:DUF3649 domain-containing protein n=2 Tax=Fulvivirga marina TaxID=2494733 RepID=A0A937KC30_9BACT|nr:hypothetical protein [Fulvivirga marina]